MTRCLQRRCQNGAWPFTGLGWLVLGCPSRNTLLFRGLLSSSSRVWHCSLASFLQNGSWSFCLPGKLSPLGIKTICACWWYFKWICVLEEDGRLALMGDNLCHYQGKEEKSSSWLARGMVGIPSPRSCLVEANGGGGRGRKRPFLWVSSLCMAFQGMSPTLPEGLPLTPIPVPCSRGCVRKQSRGDSSHLHWGMQNKSFPDAIGATFRFLQGGWLSTASFSSLLLQASPCSRPGWASFARKHLEMPSLQPPSPNLWSCSHASQALTFVLLGLALKCFGDPQVCASSGSQY